MKTLFKSLLPFLILGFLFGCASKTPVEQPAEPAPPADVSVQEPVEPAAPPKDLKAQSDDDGDGVLLADDKCPATPAGAKVDASGCWVLENVLFDFNKAKIKPEAFASLDELVLVMEKNPILSVELQGHTDNVGSEAFNMELSMKRANAVAAYLVDRGILRNRMATTGFAFKKPVALNGTEFGRALNRRVELRPY